MSLRIFQTPPSSPRPSNVPDGPPPAPMKRGVRRRDIIKELNDSYDHFLFRVGEYVLKNNGQGDVHSLEEDTLNGLMETYPGISPSASVGASDLFESMTTESVSVFIEGCRQEAMDSINANDIFRMIVEQRIPVLRIEDISGEAMSILKDYVVEIKKEYEEKRDKREIGRIERFEELIQCMKTHIESILMSPGYIAR